MLSWLPYVFLLPACIQCLGYPKYECGAHGRFEYCIDDIPTGCIIGCHCHPGYYFDTETKICEPNAKLVHDYRRLQSADNSPFPSSYISDLLSSSTEPAKTTAKNTIDPHVDNIAKDADDLGDWLYNQFFKTIERQVTNKTNTEKPLTRRSGSAVPTDESKKQNEISDTPKKSGRRKAGKLRKKTKPKIKNEKIVKDKLRGNKDLRRKLLRISEDDSLFDSSSSDESNADISSDTDSESSETSDSDDTSAEADEKKGLGSGKTYLKKTDKHDKSHGHRKILMINKKKKPPLPSFIFLPNLETPFYPPIGLPPPIMPMYPMIPVPPMPMPVPFPPYPNPDDFTSCTSTNTEGSSGTTADVETTTTTTTEHTDPDEFTTVPDLTTSQALRSATKKRKAIHFGKPGEANKLKKKHRKKPISPSDEPDPFMDVDVYNPQDFLMKDVNNEEFPTPPKPNDDTPPGGGDVDFKYLAQLIHKMNDTSGNGELMDPMRRDFPGTHSIIDGSDFHSRRNLNGRNLEKNDNNEYYTKLGHQIASIIRNLNNPNQQYDPSQKSSFLSYINNNIPNLGLTLPARENPNVGPSLSLLNVGPTLHVRENIPNLGPTSPVRETKTLNLAPSLSPRTNLYTRDSLKHPKIKPQPIFFHDNYTPRSYWERSVRSLFKRFSDVDSNYESRVDNLFTLESKFAIFASTQRPLSLHELENIMTFVASAQSRLRVQSAEEVQPLVKISSSGNLKFDLLPRQTQQNTKKIPTQMTTLRNEPFLNNVRINASLKTKPRNVMAPLPSLKYSGRIPIKKDEVNVTFRKPSPPPPPPPPLPPAPPSSATSGYVPSPNIRIKTTERTLLSIITRTTYNKNVQKPLPNIFTPKKTELNHLAVDKNRRFVTFTHKAPKLSYIKPEKKGNGGDYDDFNFFETFKSLKTTFKAVTPNNTNRLNLKTKLPPPTPPPHLQILKTKKDLENQPRVAPMHNFRNDLNGTRINYKDVLKLQSLTKNEIRGILAKNTSRYGQVSWMSPRVAQIITGKQSRPSMASDFRRYKSSKYFPNDRHSQDPYKPVRGHQPSYTAHRFSDQDHHGTHYAHYFNLSE